MGDSLTRMHALICTLAPLCAGSCQSFEAQVLRFRLHPSGGLPPFFLYIYTQLIVNNALRYTRRCFYRPLLG